jgi:imidazolonepropionase-like amidohydrolase
MTDHATRVKDNSIARGRRTSMTGLDSERPLAITGATVFDGSGRPSAVNTTVVIEGGRVARVGPAAATPPPDGASILDARGRFMIPGLTDMHVHVLGPDRQHSALFLAAGVTTVLDLGGQLPDLVAHRTAIETGATPGPRLLFAGPFLEEGEPYEGFAHMSRRVDAARIEEAVDQLARASVDAVKLYVTIRPETARRACARARSHGLRVFMHQQATWGAEAAEAGVDCVEHMMVFGQLAPESQRPPDAGRLTPFEYGGWMWRWLADVDPESNAVTRLFDRMIAAGTALDPTLVLFAARPGALGEDVGDATMDDPERTPLLPILPPRVRDELTGRWAERRRAAAGASPAAIDRMRRGWEHLLALVGRFHCAGGIVLAGTDCPNVAIVSGYSIHRELELLVRAGLSPADALLAATRRPAERLDRAAEFGTIAPGRVADLLVLSADPLADIRNTRRIERVVARGRVYDPAVLLGPAAGG